MRGSTPPPAPGSRRVGDRHLCCARASVCKQASAGAGVRLRVREDAVPCAKPFLIERRRLRSTPCGPQGSEAAAAVFREQRGAFYVIIILSLALAPGQRPDPARGAQLILGVLMEAGF